MNRPEPKFVPGDAVVICTEGANKNIHHNGRRAVVLSVEWVDEWASGAAPCWGYKTDVTMGIPGFDGHCVRECFLRPAPPDKDEPTQWDESIFVPKKECA